MEEILKITDLRKEYPEFVLEDLSLSIPRGMIMGLIGPNGAGKTTTINLLMNFIRADSGQILAFGLDSVQSSREIKDRIGFVGEEQYFYLQRSASWTGRFVAHFYSKWNQEHFDELLDRFELPRKKSIRKFSRGMKVKLSLALALSHSPEMIILDEPTSGLDPVIRQEVLDILQEKAQNEDVTILISSHITDDLERIADLITYIINGRVELIASKDDLLSNWKKIHFTQEALRPEMGVDLYSVEEHMFGSTGIIKNFESVRDRLAGGISSGDIKVENVGLDDILIELAKG